MLFFQPEFKEKEKIPPEIMAVIEALARKGLRYPYADDLELINLGRATPLIEKDGTFFYEGIVLGYLRALPPPEY